ncbi:hypothetical protein GQ43DRAFT_159413 [Delitschia confertaspora ATCC 74209]|uniref:Uncharacterized protein n=1 Tax=Delitschia confertaspora ATCC 74209 TaxID=1513339 RepID=A0A9P4JX06_9PLEO|nr:hypothetical protein GQ43DRAFT_159413 [Delitschia confertaspora ATCC 74209]
MVGPQQDNYMHAIKACGQRGPQERTSVLTAATALSGLHAGLPHVQDTSLYIAGYDSWPKRRPPVTRFSPPRRLSSVRQCRVRFAEMGVYGTQRSGYLKGFDDTRCGRLEYQALVLDGSCCMLCWQRSGCTQGRIGLSWHGSGERRLLIE